MAGLVRGHKGLIYPTSFTVASDTATVSIGNPYQIEYTITPSNATNQKINWISSDTSIATVNDKGIITAVAVGSCTISGIYSYDGTARTISVTTTQISVSGISLDKDTMRIPMRGNGRLHATVYPSNASNKNIIWTSSDDSIATVEGGLVKFKKDGNCTITATTEDGGYTDTCYVTCYIPVVGVHLDYDELTITYRTTQSLTATVYPPEAGDKSVTWSSSNINVATVDNGVITYVSNGTATITCTTVDGGYTATCNIISNNIPVTGVILNSHELTLVPGTPQQLIATISPSNASNKNFTWTSSDTSIATVNSSGVVTYVSYGNCTITCTTEDGGYVDTCSVTCGIPVQSVSLNTTSGTISSLETIQLVPTINPSNATIQTVTYSSSNTSVATVSPTGLISYVADGTAIITCTTTQGGKTATCSVTCEAFQPIDSCFGYTGAEQSITLAHHIYCIEARGASGGYSSYGGKGGYSGGCITIPSKTTVYVYVGGTGSYGGGAAGGWNGGGKSGTYGGSNPSGGGGGASDIRIGGNSLYHRRIVAGGGGGGGHNHGYDMGGAGGGICGEKGRCCAGGTTSYSTKQATQTSGASFGEGTAGCSGTTGGGGGGGWYGGGGTQWEGGSGGSGYIYTSSTCSSAPSGYCHCTDYFLTNAYTCCGRDSFPTPSGGTETGHSGNGCVRIRSID